jgi:DNA primase
MSIPPRFLDDIRSRLTLSEVIGRRIPVQRAGRESKACCPFHKEKTPSFTINDDKQFYHCFGCGAHGDVIGFVMQHDNVSFIDAVETLAADAGLQMPKPDPQAAKKAEKQRGLNDLMDEATLWMQEQVTAPQNNDVLEYLEGRGMDEDVRARFRIGYAPADGQALRKAMLQKGFNDSQMLEVNILKASTKGGDPYVFFRDRVMFPVSDRRGRVVAFGGRILPEHIRPQTGDFKPPKYINTSDTPIFDKGRMLYAESMARQAAREGHSVLVTEGYMDVIACHKAGFKGAVAPMGTALTEEQILSLWSMIPEGEKSPVLCFDGDKAGRAAADRACQRILPLLKPDQSVRFAFLPEGEDPDSMIRTQGAGAFKSHLQAALPLFDFIWASHTAGRQFETPEQRAGLEKTLNEDVAKIQDADIQRYYKQLVKTKISDTFFPRYNKGQGGGRSMPKLKKPGAQNVIKLRKPQRGNDDLKHRILLAAVINYPQIYATIEEPLGGLELGNYALDQIRQSLIVAMEENPDLDFDALQHHFKDSGQDKEIRDICCESVYVHAAFSRPALQDGADIGEIAQNWLALYESMKTGIIDEEIRDGWRQAMVSANEDEVEKLSNMIKNRGRED